MNDPVKIARDLGGGRRRDKPTFVDPIRPQARVNWYTDENGKSWATEPRPYCPTDEYRDLLSPETRAALEQRASNAEPNRSPESGVGEEEQG
jgi:hypothetical protein